MPHGRELMPLSKRHSVRWGPSSPKGGRDPQFLAHVYCGQTAGWTKMPFGMEVGLGPGQNVLDGNPATPHPNGHSPPILGPYMLWPNGWIVQDATWYGGRPRSEQHCVRWGPRSPSPKGAQPPVFGPCLVWPNSWMDQDVTWYRGRPQPSRHCVRWGPSSSLKGAWLPVFGPCLLWPNGWMDEDATWYGSRPQPGPHCVRWGPSSSPPGKGHSSPALFSAHDCCGHGRPSQLLLSPY